MSVDPALDSARAKIKRAWSYVEKLKRASEKVRSSGLSVDRPSTRDDLVIRYYKPKDDFRYLALNTGEIVHHARSALEHAIWEMVPEGSRNNRIGFPVQLTRAKFEKIAPSMIPGLSRKAATVVEEFQPFNHGNETSPLYLLHELWNVDKHRKLNACVTLPEGGVVQFTTTKFREAQTLEEAVRSARKIRKSYKFRVRGGLKDGAEVFRKTPPERCSDIAVTVSVYELEFEDGPMNGRPLIEGLGILVEYAEEIIESLAKTLSRPRR